MIPQGVAELLNPPYTTLSGTHTTVAWGTARAFLPGHVDVEISNPQTTPFVGTWAVQQNLTSTSLSFPTGWVTVLTGTSVGNFTLTLGASKLLRVGMRAWTSGTMGWRMYQGAR